MAFVTAGVPQLLDAYDIATGDAALGVAVLRPLNNGRELEIIGGITYGLTEKVAKEAKALPALRTIHLNSPGGRVTEAEMLRAFIRDHGYDTYISTECVSACSTAFLGGVRRFLHPNARIGFHVPSVAGATERDRKAAEGYAVADAVKWGVDPRFAEKAFATRHDDMWYPDASEALAAHVVTDVSDGGLAFSGLSASPDRVAVAQFLKTSEIYLAIAAAHPGVFDRLVDLFLDGAIKGTPEVELYDASGQIVHDLYEARLVAASDALLLRWMELQTAIIQAAMQADPQSCQAEVTAHGAPDQESPDASEALSQWKHDVLLEVLRHEHDVKPVTWNQAAAVSETFWDAVEARHGGAVVPMIERLNIVDDPLPESCKAALIVYETVARMPARQGAMLIRWLITPVG
ncbi:hypothetical protein [Emcibacter sp. SYSU 3D8]|uniref:COG3904 family protein n=1 Tax=Emcibacter sp. SYSU 3D8 TaxID=3133969 RepID=UPI0031FEFA71